MIKVNRTELLNALSLVTNVKQNTMDDLIKDSRAGKSRVALAFVVKKGLLKIPSFVLQDELDEMKKAKMLTVDQYDNMTNLLSNSKTGNYRVLQYIKKKNRIQIIN